MKKAARVHRLVVGWAGFKALSLRAALFENGRRPTSERSGGTTRGPNRFKGACATPARGRCGNHRQSMRGEDGPCERQQPTGEETDR